MRRASTAEFRVRPTAMRPPPRLAPSISEIASSTGTTPWAAKVATRRIEATLEWTSQVNSAPIRKAVMKSPWR